MSRIHLHCCVTCRSKYEQLSKVKTDATKGLKGGIDTRRMFDNVMKKYDRDESSFVRIPTCTIANPSEEVTKEENKPAITAKTVKQSKKRRIIRKPK